MKDAKTIEDLRECWCDIDYDIWEEMPWTMSKLKVSQAKNYMKFKKEELRRREDERKNK
jgi:hypothetical protein